MIDDATDDINLHGLVDDDAADDTNLHGLVDDDAADEDLAIRRDVDRDVLIDPLAFPL